MKLRSSLITLVCVILLSVTYAQNVLISDSFNPNEPSIMFNPDNPAIVVAGSNLNFIYTSQDTGRTWTRDSHELDLRSLGRPGH